jgi:hypothetical protein
MKARLKMEYPANGMGGLQPARPNGEIEICDIDNRGKEIWRAATEAKMVPALLSFVIELYIWKS